jgi:hypothetical protein
LYAQCIIANGGTTSTDFDVPEGIESMSIHTPVLTGTLTLQAKAPVLQENDTPVWNTVNAFDLNAGGANIALDAIPASTCTVIPFSAAGQGPFRFLSSGAEAAERDIRVAFKEI